MRLLGDLSIERKQSRSASVWTIAKDLAVGPPHCFCFALQLNLLVVLVTQHSQLKVAEMDGRAGAQNKLKPQGNAAPEWQTTKIFQKSPAQKKTQFWPPSKRTGGLTGTKKSLP